MIEMDIDHAFVKKINYGKKKNLFFLCIFIPFSYSIIIIA